jgi:hypothetical protein
MSRGSGRIALVLLVGGCGGLAATSEGGTDAVGGGSHQPSMVATDDCGGAPPDDTGCAGAGGERPLEEYAGLRAACGLNTHVTRSAAQVPLCFKIK